VADISELQRRFLTVQVFPTDLSNQVLFTAQRRIDQVLLKQQVVNAFLIRVCKKANSPLKHLPSGSVSNWSGLATSGQLSGVLGIPSLSASSSQASPTPSPSLSSWPELGVSTQLSMRHFMSWRGWMYCEKRRHYVFSTVFQS
jgi:hypothetical protein